MVHWLDEVPEYNTSPLIPLCFVTALASYGLYMAYQNITRLQQYEEQAQKAAKWSNAVAKRLHKTRATQTSGTIAVSDNPSPRAICLFHVQRLSFFGKP